MHESVVVALGEAMSTGEDEFMLPSSDMGEEVAEDELEFGASWLRLVAEPLIMRNILDDDELSNTSLTSLYRS